MFKHAPRQYDDLQHDDDLNNPALDHLASTDTTAQMTSLDDNVYVATYLEDDPIEFGNDRQLAHWFLQCPRELDKDEHLVFSFDQQKGNVEVVIEREMKNLTNEEIAKHRPEVIRANREKK